jgi:multiple sugar transport system substrate-binding protein
MTRRIFSGRGSGQRWAAALLGLVSTWISGGCGSDATTAQPDAGGGTAGMVTIKFLRHDNPNYLKADTEFFNAYMAEHPNVRIEDTTVPYNTLDASLAADLPRDQFFYDLVLMPPSEVCAYADNLTDVPAAIVSLPEAQNTFFEAPLAGSTCEGKLKGLPVEYNLEYGGVVVNLDKYEARFPGKTPTWPDWRSFISDATALAEYDAAGKPMANGLDISPDWAGSVFHMFLAQILQRGGNYWGPTGDLFDFTTPQARDALTDMVSWVTQDKIMDTSLVPPRNTGVTERLAAGATGFGWSDPARPLSVMGYIGTWGLNSTMVRVPPGSTWRYEYRAVPPMVGSTHLFVQNSGWAFSVPRTSSNAAVAWDIARSLALSADAMRRWSAITGALPALKANGTATAVSGNPSLAQVQPLLERGRWIGYIPVPALTPVTSGVLTNYWAVVAGSKTVDQALLDMEQGSNTAIEQNRGQ